MMSDSQLEIIRNLESLILQAEALTKGLRETKEQFQILRHLELKKEDRPPKAIDTKIQAAAWSDVPQGKRFLTAKELGLYLGICASTIHNEVSKKTFPIRHTKIGRGLRFDMKEILEYLDTSEPFWERDKRTPRK